MATNQRKITGNKSYDNGIQANYIDGVDPTDALRSSRAQVRPQPQGSTDQSSGTPEELSTADRYRQARDKSHAVSDNNPGVAI
jgi:hypothetical protein